MLALPLSIAAALAIDHIKHRTLIAAVAIVLAVVIARRVWGSFAVVAPTFLLPDLPTRYDVAGRLQIAILTVILARIYWDTVGRPKLSDLALGAATAFTVFQIVLALVHGTSSETAIWPCLLAFAGVMFGTSLTTSAVARAAVGYASIPLALLAVAEMLGVHNPWPALVHSTALIAESAEAGNLRGQSTFGQPLIAGACLATLAAIMLQSRTRHAAILAAVMAGGAVATVSRSAIIGVAAGMAVSLVVGPERPRKLLQFAAVAALALILITQITRLRESFTTRTTNPIYTNQEVRDYALTSIKDEWDSDPARLLLGQGNHAVTETLEAVGGVNGYYIFDNEYVTAIDDLGALPLLLIGALIVAAVARTTPQARSFGLPAMATVVVIMFFTDGLAWLSISFLVCIACGLASTHGPTVAYSTQWPPHRTSRPRRRPRAQAGYPMRLPGA